MGRRNITNTPEFKAQAIRWLPHLRPSNYVSRKSRKQELQRCGFSCLRHQQGTRSPQSSGRLSLRFRSDCIELHRFDFRELQIGARLFFAEAEKPVQISTRNVKAACGQGLVSIILAYGGQGELDFVVGEMLFERILGQIVADVDNIFVLSATNLKR